MAGLTATELPLGWQKAVGSMYAPYGVSLTWRPGADAGCTLGICSSRARRIRSLWLFVHGWRPFLLFKEGQGLRSDFAERLVGDLRERSDGAQVLAMLAGLRERGLLAG